MWRTFRAFTRLFVIARTLARHDALSLIEDLGVAPPLTRAARLIFRKRQPGRGGEKLARALSDLGPSFIKLGQFLSTRADLVGETLAADLAGLQDHLPPFDGATARAIVAEELGAPIEDLFADFPQESLSAASIAQVHMATTTDGRAVAVKVLRPGIEGAFERDLSLFAWLAELGEAAQPRLRRLKPTALVALFAEQVRLEMDLSMEAAAAQELAENFAGDPTYNVPAVDWTRTGRRVFTAEAVTGIRIDERDALIAAGHDIPDVLEKAAAIFFKQVFRDGFFHGDQHPGNMFVDAEGNIVAVDFGIMGRLDWATRTFLADMLLALLDRDYQRLAEIHVKAGYLSGADTDHSGHATTAHPRVTVFAQALRSIAEPVFGKPLHEISFARLLGQLFRMSESFEMEVQPQLLLLQKNMMMAEGVSRALDPTLNTWTLAEPLIAEWMRRHRGPEARVRDAARDWVNVAARLPATLDRVERLVAETRAGGLRLDTRQNRESRRPGAATLFAAAASVLAAAALIVALAD